MLPDEQPTIPVSPPNGSRPSPPGVWQAPSVEEMQAMLPQYEVLEILGRGGMGAVYKGRQKSLKRLVAIKILPPDTADDEMKFVERFQNEAQTMAAMNHPAIVAVHDFGETKDGLLYFIMEYVDGTDVQKMIQASGKLSDEYALAITAHVCDALQYAHSRGVIHRDIKPANIFINQEGHVKVGDFGLAKMEDPSMTSGLTKTNMAMGTPDYVAPEVLTTGMVADHRADLYAVGVMLYQMLTGEVPRGLFKLPSRKGIGSDPRFDEIICKAMEQDRNERYQSAGDLRRALDVILTTPQAKNDGTGVVAVRDIPKKPMAKGPRPPGEKSVPPQPARNPSPPPQLGAEKKLADKSARAPVRKSSATSTWLSISGIVAVLGVAGFLVLGGKPKPQASDKTNNASATAPSAKPQPPIKVRENPKPTASSTSAQGKEIDLLALVDVKRDTVAGEWSRTADGLVKTGGVGGGPRLQLPYQPPEEYDFEIEFTPTGGIGNIGQILAAQGREFGWMLNKGDQGNHRAGFGLLDGKKTTEVTETTAPLKEGIVDGRRYRSRIEVRAGRLRAFLDDTEIVNWTGDFSRLANDVTGKLRDSGHIGLRLNRDAVFHKITVREVSGAGKVDEGTATTSSSATLKTIDLLPLVDVKRNAITGEWSRDGGDLLVKAAKPDANGTPRLQLPYQPPEEYDFEIEFTPESGTNMVGQALSAYQHSFSWYLDAQLTAGNKAGFNEIDGVSVANRTDGTTMRAKFLTNGQRHRSTVEVRRNRVRALIDGETLVTWGSSPKSYDRLDISNGEKLRDALHLGLAAYDRSVRFHKITVREITGAGKLDAGTSSDAQKKQANLGGWTDWLGPKLATGTFGPPVWKVEKDGLTSEKPLSGRNILPGEIRDASVRVTYDLRDSGGIQVAMRERIGKPEGRELYVADDTGVSLYIARMLPDGTIKKLISRDYPNQTPRAATRTLEFRCLGETLTATVTGAMAEPFIVTATDTALQSGTVAVSLKKGLLLKKVEIADGEETVDGATTVAQLDEDFIRAVAAAPPEEQVSLVTTKLKVINGAQVTLVPTITGGKVKALRVERKGDALLPDISPLAALKDLTDLRMMYVVPADISSLGGLPLERLEIHGGSFEDISVLKSIPLRFLGLHGQTQSSQEALDFTILRGMKLVMLHLSSKRLVDISFIKGMPLKDLNLTGSGVRDFSPIAGMPLSNLEFDPEAKPDMALLRSIPTLKTINKRPAAEYLKTLDGASATAWTDWLTPKLASGTFDGGQWKREPGGFTTHQSLAGYEVLPVGTKDGAIKVTFSLRDSEGVMINVRETKAGGGQHQYTAQYTGTSLYIAHASSRLTSEPMPKELQDRPEHTLEFRFEGEYLVAILDGTHRVSARQFQLSEGKCTVVLTKGVLVKKIEMQTLSPP